MIDLIHEDILRFHRLSHYSISSRFLLIWFDPGLTTLIVYRLGQWLKSIDCSPLNLAIILLLKPLYWLLTAYCRLAYDIQLEQSAKIGPGLFIGHLGGIRIRNCRLGANCSIHQEVYIGSEAGSNFGPIIGNQVWIGAHARIQGMLKVGDRATIAAGTIVKKDVREECLLMGNPGRIVKIKFDNSSIM